MKFDLKSMEEVLIENGILSHEDASADTSTKIDKFVDYIGKVAHTDKITSVGDFTYVDRIVKDPAMMKRQSTIRVGDINALCNFMAHLYMESMCTIDVEPEFFSSTNSDKGYNLNSRDRYVETARNLHKVYGMMKGVDINNLMFKINSSTCSIYVLISSHDTMKLSDRHSFGLAVFQFIPESNVMIMYRVLVDDDESIYHVASPVYVSKKQRYAEKLIKMSDCTSDIILSADQLNLVNRIALLIDRFDITNKNLEQSRPSHTVFERSIVSRIFKRYLVNNKSARIRNIDIWTYGDSEMITSNRTIFGVYAPMLAKLDTESVPLVKFSNKEWDFIARYINGKLVQRTSDEHTVVCINHNMKDVFINQRYGPTLKFVYRGKDDKQYDLVFTYLYDIESDMLRLYILSDNNPVVASFIIADYRDVSSFNLTENVIGIRSSFYMKDLDNIPLGYNDVVGMVPPIFQSIKDVIDVILDAVSICLVIHDRPQRHKIVREEHDVVNKARSNIRASATRKSNDSLTSRGPIVSRILMPSNEAKEYVARMSAGNNSERRYVIESWERRGHWRRKPHSEEKIWIDETTCNRRKEITADTDIVIKL